MRTQHEPSGAETEMDKVLRTAELLALAALAFATQPETFPVWQQWLQTHQTANVDSPAWQKLLTAPPEVHRRFGQLLNLDIIERAMQHADLTDVPRIGERW